jgi:carboxypeptidase C (cathepsin A)
MPDEQPTPPDASKEADKKNPRKLVEKEPVITQHELALAGRTLHYTVTTGTLPLKDDKDELEALIFTMAYTLDQPEGSPPRPLVFVFNGGPGSASLWLHMGAVGPYRVQMAEGGFVPPAPFQRVANESTWLDIADLVFIDPVGTGFSRAVSEEKDKKFWSFQGDIDSVGEIIRLYIARNNRWLSPLFLAGESYGTTRAAALSDHLIGRGIAFNGIILISSAMYLRTIFFTLGDDLPYALFLPTYAATAWYHKRLPADLLERPLADVLTEVEAWAQSDYTVALMKGDTLSERERSAVSRKLERYSGLPRRVIEGTNLRIQIFRFCKELMRDERRSVGRIDSRYIGIERDTAAETPEFDPSLTTDPPFVATFNSYVRGVLGYETDLAYHSLSMEVNEKWDWGKDGLPNTSEALRSAMAKNPFMKIFVAQGYYDLATPHFATEYMLNHMNIDAALRENVRRTRYEAGHMFYVDTNILMQFKQDIADFMHFAQT